MPLGPDCGCIVAYHFMHAQMENTTSLVHATVIDPPCSNAVCTECT